MHSAPVVRYPVARSSRAGWFAVGIWAAGAALCIWWPLQPAVGGWRALSGMACVLACAVLAVLQWRALPQGALQWDGARWWWCSGAGERPVAVRLRLDLGAAMLLHLADLPGRARWCLVERRLMPMQWSDLRRAVHAPVTGVAA